MKKYSIFSLFIIGMFALFTSCEKEGDKVTMLDNPVAPVLNTLPDLNLQRVNASETLSFTGTTVDPGFQASATYVLEASVSGTSFAEVITIASEIKPEFSITVNDLNNILVKKFPADQESDVDFRIKAVLVVDAGTGAPGTSADPFEYFSDVITASVNVYGLPRLDLIGSGLTQKIESALDNGEYVGYVKLTPSNAFTLTNPTTGISYGFDGNGGLVENGSAISITNEGWHKLSANLNDMTYELIPYMIGLIGDATPNGWSAPDQKMDYDYQNSVWYITLDLVAGTVKFRLNDDWNSGINLGIGDADHPEYTTDNLWNSGSSQNIPIASDGNYTIKLYIGTSKYSCTITKN